MKEIKEKIESEIIESDLCDHLEEDCSNSGLAKYELIDGLRLCKFHAIQHCNHIIEEFTIELEKIKKLKW